jgi:hypothetical protein
MIRPLDTGRLVLTPQDPYLLPDDPDTLVCGLQAIGFIGQALHPGPGYLLGERFMQLVSFLGCSPYIRLAPDESGEAFCHLRLDGPYSHPKLLSGKNTQPPRCGACRKRLLNWRNSFETWQAQKQGWQAVCPHCGEHQDPAHYDFRQSAGCGRLFLLVENIFPQEAIPSPELLEALKKASSNQPWHHFYLQD